MALTQTVAPATEPITLTDVKAHLRLDISDDDTLINGLIQAARAYAEFYTDRQFVTATFQQTFDGFPDEIRTGLPSSGFASGTWMNPSGLRMPATLAIPTLRLRKAPCKSITSIEYIDVSQMGTNPPAYTTLATSRYLTDLSTEPARLTPAYGNVWPVTLDVTNSVRVTFTAGYGTASDVPQPIKQAMYMLIAHWYENREASTMGPQNGPVAFAVDALLWSYRILEVR